MGHPDNACKRITVQEFAEIWIRRVERRRFNPADCWDTLAYVKRAWPRPAALTGAEIAAAYEGVTFEEI
jgi:hypothetical protein